MVLVLCEMQSVSFRIWTRVAVFISYDDNHYTTGTSTNCWDNSESPWKIPLWILTSAIPENTFWDFNMLLILLSSFPSLSSWLCRIFWIFSNILLSKFAGPYMTFCCLFIQWIHLLPYFYLLDNVQTYILSVICSLSFIASSFLFFGK